MLRRGRRGIGRLRGPHVPIFNGEGPVPVPPTGPSCSLSRRTETSSATPNPDVVPSALDRESWSDRTAVLPSVWCIAGLLDVSSHPLCLRSRN